MVWIDRLFFVLACVAGGFAGIMMVLTTADVIGRYVFNRPLYGAFEATEIMMGLLIFAALPLCTRHREHIVVGILYDVLPPIFRRVTTVLFEILCAGICLLIAWRMWLYGDRLIRFREVTLEFGIPRGGIVTAMSVLLVVTALAFLLNAARAAATDPGRVGGSEKI
jgi:TRAP-type transport system small permease protein